MDNVFNSKAGMRLEMRVATWNIYWLGERSDDKIIRSAEDLQVIADVIKTVSPDVMAFQEIVNPDVLQDILTRAHGDAGDYVIRADDGIWLTSDSDPTKPTSNLQKVFLCLNRKTIEFVQGAAIRGGPPGRKPYAALLRDRSSGTEFVVVAVHLRSGFPDFLGADDAAVRQKEATAVANWLSGEAAAKNPSFPQPTSAIVMLLGDFNAERDDPNQSLDPLRAGPLANWSWNDPSPDAGQRTTAIDDGYVIDFIMLSPDASERVTQPPTVYAFDHDPQLGGPARFHVGANGSGRLRDYRVSDHRPVIATLDLE